MHPKLKKITQLSACLFSRGVVDLLRNPGEARGYWRRIIDAALYQSENHSDRLLSLPCYNADEVIPGADSVPVTLIDYQYTYGDMPFHEIITLCKIVRYKQPKILFEIGTYLGGTTLQLAANSKAVIYTLDLPPRGHRDYVEPQVLDSVIDVYPEEAGIRFRGSVYEHRISQLFGNSQTFDFSPYYGTVDLVLVDASHHYDFVFRDSMNAFKMVAPGGIVVWHDYATYEPGVVKALGELGRDFLLNHLQGTSLVIWKMKG